MTTNTTPLDVGVIGVGAMGQHHARVYSELPNVHLVGVFDVDPDRASEIAHKHGSTAMDIDDLLTQADAVSVVVPTQYHLDIATQCLQAGVAPLIEKPVVEDLSEGETLIELRDEAELPVQVGHIERFNPAIRTLSDVLADVNVLSFTAERLGPPPNREIDDSAVLDLMIHDLDIILSLVDGEPTAISSAGISENKHATATIEFDSGEIASLTASRMTQRKVRTLEITAEECFIEVDYIDQSIEIHRQSAPEYIEQNGDIRYRHESIVERPTISNGEPLRNELESFVRTVKNGGRPVVSIEDGLNALELATRIDNSESLTEEEVSTPLQ